MDNDQTRPNSGRDSGTGSVPVDADLADLANVDEPGRTSRGVVGESSTTTTRSTPVVTTASPNRVEAVPVVNSKNAALDEAHRRAGGIDWWATFAGTLAALGTAVILGGLLTAAGAETPLKDVAGKTQLSVGGAIGALVILVIAFYIGGLVAGRMARYDGARNGLLTALWFLIIASILGAIGAKKGSDYNVLKGAHVPGWVDRNVFNGVGIAYAVIAVVVMFLAAFLGGKIGARWHRKADDALLDYPTTAVRTTR